MNAQETVRQQLGFWHGTLDSMLKDCSSDTVNKKLPGSTCNSIGVIFAHTVFSEDGIVNGMFEGKPPIYVAQGWEAKTGVPHPGTGPGQDPDWASKVNMDIPKFQEYAKAVYANTDAYLSSLSDADLEKKVQGPIGETTVGWFLTTILATHFPGHAGEIAALKGVQGLKGLPF
jgi:DinB superfamily